jgi:hypothetical protein
MDEKINDDSPQGKRNRDTNYSPSRERHIKMKHARADHTVTDYETRLLGTIADRVDVDTGETELVSDWVLAIESCAKSRGVVRNARCSLRQKGYLGWKRGAVKKGEGYPNISRATQTSIGCCHRTVTTRTVRHHPRPRCHRTML